MVAVAITVGMLSLVGMVFKSSTEASGKAEAHNEIMQQLRAVTMQLEQDFAGLEPSAPLAIVFETHQNSGIDPTNEPHLGDPEDTKRWVRYDRVVFFTKGNFQTPDLGTNIPIYSSLGRVFYGQTRDGIVDDLRPGEMKSMYPGDPGEGLRRQILARRWKILTQDVGLDWNYTPGNTAQYDYQPVDFKSLAYWKGLLYDVSTAGVYDYKENYFRTDYTVAESIVRRPSIWDLGGVGNDGVQRLYLLGDVTDFKVELWFGGAQEWFPSADDIEVITSSMLPPSIGPGISGDIYGFQPFALFWNVDGTAGYPSDDIDGVLWYSEQELVFNGLSQGQVWPRALRFTFTLYDKGRRHFPEGRTFNYIVQIPPRD